VPPPRLGQADLGQQFEQSAFTERYERAVRIPRQRLEAEILGRLAQYFLSGNMSVDS
jgi:hypothetical protein